MRPYPNLYSARFRFVIADEPQENHMPLRNNENLAIEKNVKPVIANESAAHENARGHPLAADNSILVGMSIRGIMKIHPISNAMR